MNRLRILCHNCHGMTTSKFITLLSLLNTTYDIIFIQEHWFTKDYISLVSTHPTFFIGSPPPVSRRLHGHENGGLCIIMDPSLHFYTKLIYNSEFLIVVKMFSSITIGNTYLPFRLDIHDLVHNWIPENQILDILIGDFNFHSTINYSKKNTETSRKEMIFRITNSKGLDWVLPNYKFDHGSISSGPDHMFMNFRIQKNLIDSDYRPISDYGIFSDHGFLRFEIEVPFFSTVPTEYATRRFFIRKLRKEPISGKFGKAFDDCWKSNQFDSVNAFDLALRTTIKSLSEKILGSYIVQDIKLKDDKLLEIIGTTQDIHEDIMLFKRANRGKQIIFESSSATSTVLNEAFNHTKKFGIQKKDHLN